MMVSLNYSRKSRLFAYEIVRRFAHIKLSFTAYKTARFEGISTQRVPFCLFTMSIDISLELRDCLCQHSHEFCDKNNEKFHMQSKLERVKFAASLKT